MAKKKATDRQDKTVRITFTPYGGPPYPPKTDRPPNHKNVDEACALEQLYAKTTLFLMKYLERHLRELSNDISYISIAQRLHITFTHYLLSLIFALCDFFVRQMSAPFFWCESYSNSLRWRPDSPFPLLLAAILPLSSFACSSNSELIAYFDFDICSIIAFQII